ncbi:MAG: caspase family protein [Snowella sp.]|nr:caspase family protein [Snowella sp.]
MTAVSLHIGLNKVSAAVYGSENRLGGCINDAKAMCLIAQKLGYRPTVMFDEQATVQALNSYINAVSDELKAGDIFWLTYSGHGSQILDTNNDEADCLDETWCLYNGQIVDDDLYKLWSKFAEGVRLVVVSDSCHSGTVARGITTIEEVISRDIDCKASGILLSGCRDNQVSLDTGSNGLFTAKLLEVWNDGKFAGSYSKFLKAIAAKLPKSQNPNYYTFGKRSMKFLRQNPFMI